MTKLSFTRAQRPETLFQALSQFQDDLERRIAFGSDTVSFSGLSNQASVAVVHQLPVAPAAILITGSTRSGINLPLSWEATGVTASQFTATGGTVDGQTPSGGSTQIFYWFAIV